jgi:hypothetical protein
VDAEKHNKLLAYAHLGYAGFQLLILALVYALMLGIFMAAPSPVGREAPVFMAVVLLFVFLVQLAFLAPSMVAGYGLLKRRSWARVAAMVAGAAASMSAPFGTAVCVYTFVFLFSESGKRFFEPGPPPARPVASLFAPPDPSEVRPADWRAYAPPPEPPDWRD